MKHFALAKQVEDSGEVAMGPQQSGMLTTYLIYGVLAPGETGRRLRPGRGREEILFLINGKARIEQSGRNSAEIVFEGGSAIPLPEGSDYWLSNLTSRRVEYVIAGGFTEPVHFLRKIQDQMGEKTLAQTIPESLKKQK